MSSELAVAFILLAIMGILCIIGFFTANNDKIQNILYKLLLVLVGVLAINLILLFVIDTGVIQ